METVTYLINNYSMEIIIGTYAFLILMFLLLIIQMAKTSKLKKRYNAMFKGESVSNIEDMLLSNKLQLDSIMDTHNEIKSRILNIENALKHTFSKFGVYRYDAFSGLAGKLSFVYVLLDASNCGVILNGIYSNEGHYLYIKEVLNGKTEKELSKEERATLEQVIAK